MRTKKQREASRINGAKSKGPITGHGKHRSSRNSVRHGILAVVHPVEGEPEEVYDDAVRDLNEVLRPANDIEARIVRAIGVDLVRSQRIDDYLRTSRELRLDDLEEEDAGLQEELHRLRTALARWDRWRRELEYSAVITPKERLTALRELSLLVEKSPDEDPRNHDSAYHHLEWLREINRQLELGGCSLSNTKIQERARRIASTHVSSIENRIRTIEDRIAYRRQLRERMIEAIPDERTLKLVARYQGLIDNGLSRRLGLLRDLREASRGV